MLPLCAGHMALAFQQAGHFYSVSVVASTITPPLAPSEAKVVSFCAELPDHSSDVDAVKVYLRSLKKSWKSPGVWARWARSDEAGSEWIRRMVTVQQLLHGLTGGSAPAVESVAANTVRKLRQQVPGTGDPAGLAAWCAVGFGLHLYGDALAHRVIGSGGSEPDRMYATGRGHAAHIHYPDWPLCGELVPKRTTTFNRNCNTGPRRRFDRWANYLKDAVGYLTPGASGGAMNPQVHDEIIADVLKLAARASDLNEWQEANIRSTLVQAGADQATGKFLESHDSSAPCQDVLDLALKDKGPLAGIPRFTCRDAWGLFYKVVLPEFISNKDAREPLGSNPDSAYIPDPLLK